MSQEDKELLLKDLCARLPYGVYVHIRHKEVEPCYGKLTPIDIQWFIDSKIEDIKPYLRPMSSMTDEEIHEFSVLGVGIHLFKGPLIPSYGTLDWLNKKMFDYRGLIEKGLALEAPKYMYNLNE